MKKITRERIILASQSPRRKELLEQTDITFDIIPSSIDETIIKKDDPEEFVRTLSHLKAMDIARKNIDAWVLGADTIVYSGKSILEKPNSKAHAATMLKTLSNRSHSVYTSFTLCCISKNKTIVDIVKTDVFFKKISDQEIKWYVDTGEYLDKAGGYAIQGKGGFLVEKIHGSYSNVVGLPICEVIECLISQNIIEF